MIVPLDGLLLLFSAGSFALLIESESKNPWQLFGGTAVPRFERPFSSIEELHETQLDDFEAMFRAGAAMAIPAAVHYCAEHGLVAPAWLTKASAELFCTILRSDTRKTIARANDVVRPLRGDMRDFARWDAVCEVEDERKHFRREVAKLRALPKTPRELPQKREKLLKEMEERLKSLGATLDCAFECASERLAKTGASGGRDSMEKSYYKVEKIFKDPAQAMRYRQLDQRFLQKVGLKPIMPPPKRKKAVPLFKLTDQRIAVTVSGSRGATIARENIGDLKYSRSAQSRRRR